VTVPELVSRISSLNVVPDIVKIKLKTKDTFALDSRNTHSAEGMISDAFP
jgi:hypothetical protein